MKQVGQVIGSIIYTLIFGIVVYYLTVLPIAWVLSLSTLWKIVIGLVAMGAIIGIVSSVLVFALFPFKWLLKDNKVALVISIGLFVVNVITNCISIWKANLAIGGFWPIFFAIEVTIMLVFIVVSSTQIMTQCYNGES